jgi:sugar phosphate isomerase/epimerase
MPYSGIPDIKKGWAVVEASGCDNAKLILDTWHWVRANQENDVKLLEGIPADKIVSIQINDVYDRPYAKSILRDESMHDRLAPGTGTNVTEGFVNMIKEKGINPAVIGVEVISDAILEKGVAEAAKHTFDNTMKVLEKAWPEVLPQA